MTTATDALRQQVTDTANELDAALTGRLWRTPDGEFAITADTTQPADYEPAGIEDWLTDQLEVEVGEIRTLGTTNIRRFTDVLVTYGGPTIRVDGRTGVVTGRWGADEASREVPGLADALAEFAETFAPDYG